MTAPEKAASESELVNLEPLQDLDRQLLQLLLKRWQLAQSYSGTAIEWMGASNALFPTILGETELPAGLEEESIAAWLRHTASLCRHPDVNSRVAYLGPKFSYSYLATTKFFGDAAPLAPVDTIEAVFEAVACGDCHAGVVPIENSTDGRIVDTLGMLVKHRLGICGEVLLPIHHNLLCLGGRETIVKVCSKPQALSQCRQWLARHLPQAELSAVASTTEAARMASEQPGVAAVASAEAARQYGLQVVDSKIEDNRNNVTRFAILGTATPAPSGRDKTTMLFQVTHKPGALADAMGIFRDRDLNLTWIESFPIPGQKAEYFFFVEAEGHRDEPKMRDAVSALKQQSLRLDVLGSYPVGTIS